MAAAQGGFINPVGSGIMSPDFYAQELNTGNQMLGGMGMQPYTPRTNPLFSNQQMAAHPTLFGGVTNALLNVASTPEAPMVSGVGSGIQRAVQGVLGGHMANMQFQQQQAMMPFQIAQMQMGVQQQQMAMEESRRNLTAPKITPVGSQGRYISETYNPVTKQTETVSHAPNYGNDSTIFDQYGIHSPNAPAAPLEAPQAPGATGAGMPNPSGGSPTQGGMTSHQTTSPSQSMTPEQAGAGVSPSAGTVMTGPFAGHNATTAQPGGVTGAGAQGTMNAGQTTQNQYMDMVQAQTGGLKHPEVAAGLAGQYQAIHANIEDPKDASDKVAAATQAAISRDTTLTEQENNLNATNEQRRATNAFTQASQSEHQWNDLIHTGGNIQGQSLAVNPKAGTNQLQAPGWMQVNPKTGDVMPQDAKPEVTSDDQKRSRFATSAISSIDQMSALVAKAEGKLNGPIQGPINDAMNKAGLGNEWTAAMANYKTFAQSAATAAHTGRFSSEILQKMNGTLSTNANADQLKGQMESTKEVMGNYQNTGWRPTVSEYQQFTGGQGGATMQTGPGGSGKMNARGTNMLAGPQASQQSGLSPAAQAILDGH